jgi:hypothetical protein
MPQLTPRHLNHIAGYSGFQPHTVPLEQEKACRAKDAARAAEPPPQKVPQPTDQSFAALLKEYNEFGPAGKEKPPQHKFYKSQIVLAPKMEPLNTEERQQLCYTSTITEGTPWHEDFGNVGRRENLGQVHWAGTKETKVFPWRRPEAPLLDRSSTHVYRAYTEWPVHILTGGTRKPPLGTQSLPTLSPGASQPPAEKPAEPAKSPPPVPPLNLAKGGTRRLKTPEHGSKPLHLMSPGQISLEGAMLGRGFNATSKGPLAQDNAGRGALRATFKKLGVDPKTGAPQERQGIPGWKTGVRKDPQGVRVLKEEVSPRTRIIMNAAAIQSKPFPGLKPPEV